jgi:hypothetical protein
LSYINRNRARQTGTNRTTQAEVSNLLRISFPGRVTQPRISSYEWMRIRGHVTLGLFLHGTSWIYLVKATEVLGTETLDLAPGVLGSGR